MGDYGMSERELMGSEEFENYLGQFLKLKFYGAVGKYKSIRRAIRKGYVTPDGMLCPSRPFNNRKNTCRRKGKHSRKMNETKKEIYGQLRQYTERHDNC